MNLKNIIFTNFEKMCYPLVLKTSFYRISELTSGWIRNKNKNIKAIPYKGKNKTMKNERRKTKFNGCDKKNATKYRFLRDFALDKESHRSEKEMKT